MMVNLANPKTKKTYSVKLDNQVYLGKKIGDDVSLDVIGVSGKGIITGGSTKEGIPLAPFLNVPGYKKVLLTSGFGFKEEAVKGEKKRKNVHGMHIDDKIAQLNIKITDLKEDKLDEKFGKKETSKE
jgi:ribosomal protein S6E (S10)